MLVKQENPKEIKKKKAIGSRLLLKRREMHYTQEEMAQLIDVSAGFYGMIERGERTPSVEKLILIHERLKMDITFLLTGEGNRQKSVDYIEKCPEEIRYDFEQLMRHALNLVEYMSK